MEILIVFKVIVIFLNFVVAYLNFIEYFITKQKRDLFAVIAWVGAGITWFASLMYDVFNM